MRTLLIAMAAIPLIAIDAAAQLYGPECIFVDEARVLYRGLFLYGDDCIGFSMDSERLGELTASPDFAITSLGGVSQSGALGVARSIVTGAYHLFEYSAPGSPQPSVPRSSPIGFPNIQALAVTWNGPIIAASIDESTATTTLVSVDPATGVGTILGTAISGEVLVGLGAIEGDRIFAVSREAAGTSPSRLFEIDPVSGSASLLAELPIACDALAPVTNCLVGLGDEACFICIEGASICIDVAEIAGDTPAHVIGAAEHTFTIPTLRRSWGSIKAAYRR
jgi:hypothetical protein